MGIARRVPNGSVAASCRIAIPAVHYANAAAAIVWLSDVFDAEPRKVIEETVGIVNHAELWFGSACVTLGSISQVSDRSAMGRGGVYIAVESAGGVDALHERAVAKGARITQPLGDRPYNGSREFAAVDPEGNLWCFGTYRPS